MRISAHQTKPFAVLHVTAHAADVTWARHEATAGMFGDLRGIAGKALDELDGLSLPLLESGSRDGSE
jgi:hypothetical protein